jgi:hypothetical protein
VETLVEIAYSVGWLVFLYLGGAGAYELLGGRKYRASLLLAGAFIWIVLTFVYFRYAGIGAFRLFSVVLYFAACYVLVRKVHGDLGKTDIR